MRLVIATFAHVVLAFLAVEEYHLFLVSIVFCVIKNVALAL
jgi:hypothetical protein